jgi:hypothetical protein
MDRRQDVVGPDAELAGQHGRAATGPGQSQIAGWAGFDLRGLCAFLLQLEY